MTRSLLALLIPFAATLPVSGQAPAQASERIPVVVELFTSEGCSSCPPADQVLARLAGLDRPGARRGSIPQNVDIIVLGEHVDYWDSLGWRDRFSSPLFSARQQDYGKAFAAETIYTPQAVINGETEVLGSDYRAVSRAIRTAAEKAAEKTKLANVELSMRTADTFHVRVGRIPDGHNADLLLAVTEDDLDTRVGSGENDGRHLEHVAVVRSISKLAELESGKPLAYVADARLNLHPDWNRNQLKLVLLVQDRESKQILGAAAVKP